MSKKKRLNLKKLKIKLPTIHAGSRFGLAQNRHRDWNTVLWTTVGLAVLVAILSFYMFYRIDSGTIFRDHDFETVEKRDIDLNDLDAVVKQIEKERMLFEEKLLSVPETSDPAL